MVFSVQYSTVIKINNSSSVTWHSETRTGLGVKKPKCKSCISVWHWRLLTFALCFRTYASFKDILSSVLSLELSFCQRNQLIRGLVKRWNLFFFWLCCASCGILIPQPGIKPMPPALEVQSLNHGTFLEVHEPNSYCRFSGLNYVYLKQLYITS